MEPLILVLAIMLAAVWYHLGFGAYGKLLVRYPVSSPWPNQMDGWGPIIFIQNESPSFSMSSVLNYSVKESAVFIKWPPGFSLFIGGLEIPVVDLDVRFSRKLGLKLWSLSVSTIPGVKLFFIDRFLCEQARNRLTELIKRA